MTRKLVDDCFLSDRDQMRHGEAIALLKSRVATVVGTERVLLAEALGRTLAEPVVALFPVPAHTNAAVDGYAFAARDLAGSGGRTLPLSGRSAAGHPLRRDVEPGSVVRVLTGAVMPEGCDTVVMQEDVELIAAPGGKGADVMVRIPSGLKIGANIRRAGEDVTQGTVMFPAGHAIRPQDMAALASVGLAEALCHERVRVGIVSTGDEVIRAGARALERGEVYDANAPMLAGLVSTAGGRAFDLGVSRDEPDVIRRALVDAARDHHLILTSGGASRGEEDHLAAALEAVGTRHLWQLAIKPGRPMMLGQIGDCVVVGLPGNPVAVFVCFLMYVWPMLRRLGGAPWPEPRRLKLPAGFAFEGRKKGRREFWRAMLVEGPEGLAVDKFERDGSGLISGLRAADGLIEVPEDAGDVASGDLVDFIPFSAYGF